MSDTDSEPSVDEPTLYVPLNEAQSFVGVKSSTADAQVLDALMSACREVDARCGRRFYPDTEPSTRRFRPSDRWTVDVDDFHTLEGLVVTVDGVELDADDFEVEGGEAGGVVRPYSRIVSTTRMFPTRRLRNVAVTACWGWAEPPEPVRQAVRLLTLAAWKRKDAPFGVAGFSEFGSVRVREDPDVARLLGPFTRLVMA